MGTKMPAIQAGRLLYPTLNLTAVNSTTQNMSATTDIVTLIGFIPQTGTITGVKFATASVTTGCTLGVTIETVNAAKPTTTLYNANATQTVVVANTDDNVVKTATFASSFTGTKGDMVAITLRVSSGTPSVLGIRTAITGKPAAYPCLYVNIATVDGWGTNTPLMWLVYDTGDVALHNTTTHSNGTNLSISSSTTPDEVGILFTAPFSFRTDGYTFRTGTMANAQNVDVILYDSSNNVCASHSLTGASLAGSGLNNFIDGVWPTDFDCIKGRQYRLVIKPTSTTTWTNTISRIDSVSAFTWGGTVAPQYTQRTDAGAWTETSTSTLPMALSISKVYQPGGSYF